MGSQNQVGDGWEAAGRGMAKEPQDSFALERYAHHADWGKVVTARLIQSLSTVCLK